MEKFPFTEQGIKDLQAGMYLQADHPLCEEARSVVTDTLEWIALKFELAVHQLEALRQYPEHLKIMWGISLAQAILTRRPFAIQFYDQPGSFRDFVVTSSITCRYDAANKKKSAGGRVVISFEPE